MRKNNILLIIPNLGLGGAQKVFYDHSQMLAKQYNVIECVFNLDSAKDHKGHHELYELRVSGGNNVISKVQKFIIRCIRLKHLKQLKEITVSVSHLEGADYVNVLSGIGDKRIICVHGSKLHDRNIKGLLGFLRQRLLIPIFYRRADRVVAVSNGIYDELVHELGLPAAKVQVINNFFEEKKILQQASIELSTTYDAILSNYPVIITSCRFAPEKNLISLLNLFSQVKKRIPSCKLMIIGSGEQYSDLLKQCIILSLSVYTPDQADETSYDAAVLLVGFQENPHAFTTRASVFVLPSLNEGFPMALGEAMICGCPVIAADCPTGPREILAPDTVSPAIPLRQAERAKYGFLLPIIDNPLTRASDEQVWVDTLSDLLINTAEQKRLANLSRERMQDFTREKIASQWMHLVEDLLQ